MDEKIGWGILGAGNIATQFATDLRRLDGLGVINGTTYSNL